MGVFAAVKPGQLGNSVRFKNNRLSAVLREDHPNCLRHMVSSTAHNCQDLCEVQLVSNSAYEPLCAGFLVLSVYSTGWYSTGWHKSGCLLRVAKCV